MKNENVNALDEIHKGACMGMDAIKYTVDKVKDMDLKKVLRKQYKDYQKIAKEIEQIYPEYNAGQPHETSTMTKAMTWYGIEMNTFMDKSNSKIAEMLLQGVNMGVIEGRKILNNKSLDSKVSDIISNYVSMQEVSVEVLKKYL